MHCLLDSITGQVVTYVLEPSLRQRRFQTPPALGIEQYPRSEKQPTYLPLCLIMLIAAGLQFEVTFLAVPNSSSPSKDYVCSDIACGTCVLPGGTIVASPDGSPPMDEILEAAILLPFLAHTSSPGEDVACSVVACGSSFYDGCLPIAENPEATLLILI